MHEIANFLSTVQSSNDKLKFPSFNVATTGCVIHGIVWQAKIGYEFEMRRVQR